MVTENRKGAGGEEKKPAEEAAMAAAPSRGPMFSSTGYLVLAMIVILEGVLIYFIVKLTSKPEEGAPIKTQGDSGFTADVYIDVDEVVATLRGGPPEKEKHLRITFSVGVDRDKLKDAETLIKEKKAVLVQAARLAMVDTVSYSDATGGQQSAAEERLRVRIYQELQRLMGPMAKGIAIKDFSTF